VGIGASAGGLEAVTELLKQLPPTPGMAFVVVQHLDPTHESALPSLLGRVTALKVAEAKHNLKLEVNHVYVVPPNKVMRIAKRRLKLTPRKTEKEIRLPIDQFLESLAEEEADRAIGVILSGNGSDGTRGLLAIKSAGGVTFAQDDRSAKYTSMPASAVAAGCVDFVLPPGQIAQELVALAGRGPGAEIPLLPSTSKAKGEERAFEEILEVLRLRTGVDFSQYKRPTLDRRIHRRMGLRKLETMRQYADYLRGQAAEAQELFNDVLIHVTNFFRDKTMFATLKKKILPRLIKGRGPDEALRIWVPGCSTGEEVYSLAITIMEFLGETKRSFPVQIFGTDINTKALERARAGFYPASIAADVSAERLRRFFVKSDSGHRVGKMIREMCVFARQNVAVDPPFSSLDIISCRNLLIYLGLPLQRKVFPVFHYALKAEGFLILGASETTGVFVDLFTLADKKAKFYAKRATPRRPAVTFGHSVPEHKAGPSQSDPREAAAATVQVGSMPAEVQRQADRIVLAHYSPPGVVINREMEVLQFRGRTALYLEHPHGEASLNLMKIVREELALDLRATVNKAMKTSTRVRKKNIRVQLNSHFSHVHIEVLPFTAPPSEERFYLVTFEAAAEADADAEHRGRDKKGRAAAERKESREHTKLREELAATRESLQAIIEEQEATNEELRSANEEITSSNEELQSTNEELETAKEELQSTNEELTTLNDELESRNSELENANNDLHNVMTSVNIPIVMVGHDMRIRRFTAAAEKVLNLIPGDVGRPITDIKLKVELPDLDKKIAEVIDTLQTRDVEMQDRGGRWWSVRIRPYKTTDQKIDGAVIAFVDVETQKNPPLASAP
jgi:two-component system CheB/CheR fusion protein